MLATADVPVVIVTGRDKLVLRRFRNAVPHKLAAPWRPPAGGLLHLHRCPVLPPSSLSDLSFRRN